MDDNNPLKFVYGLFAFMTISFVICKTSDLESLEFVFLQVFFLLIPFIVIYLILKLLYWDHFPMGTAPILIAVCFFSSMQLFFIGIIGEYLGAVLTQVLHRPLVIEKERINF